MWNKNAINHQTNQILSGTHMAHDPCANCGGIRTIDCSPCGGSGLNPDSGLLHDQCPKCKGTGRERCQKCQGTGEWRAVGIAANDNF